MRRIGLALPFLLILFLPAPGNLHAQSPVTESPELRAKAAMDRGDYLIAIPLLSEALSQRPSADVYLNLGTAYRFSRDWQKAEDTLQEGTERFPEDPRLSREL